jgi:hypothetical protein
LLRLKFARRKKGQVYQIPGYRRKKLQRRIKEDWLKGYLTKSCSISSRDNMSDSKNLTCQEIDELYPLPTRYDMKKLKGEQLDMLKKIIKEKNPRMSDDEVLNDAKETIVSFALKNAIYFLGKHFPQLSSDSDIARFLQKASLRRDLHKLFMYDGFPFDEKCNYSGDSKVRQAELVRDWVCETCVKLKDNCFIGGTATRDSLQNDVKKARQMIQLDKVINDFLSAKSASPNSKKES